jgi:hypothetical protein
LLAARPTDLGIDHPLLDKEGYLRLHTKDRIKRRIGVIVVSHATIVQNKIRYCN